MKTLLQVYLLICIFVDKSQAENNCTNLLESYQNEEVAVQGFIEDNKNKIDLSCLELSVQKSWGDLSRQLINRFNKKKIDLFPLFIKIRKQISPNKFNLFENLTHYLPLDSPSLRKIEPCYFWAQNMTHSLVKVKFVANLGNPSYSQMNRITVNISIQNFSVSALSFQGDYPIMYYLQIKTYKFMTPFYSDWKIVEQGQVILEIMKSPSPYVWRNLLSDQFENPPNQYIWWEMYYQYKDSMQAAFGLLEDHDLKWEEIENNNLFKEDQIIRDKTYVSEMDNYLDSWKKRRNYQNLQCKKTRSLKFNVDPFSWNNWI